MGSCLNPEMPHVSEEEISTKLSTDYELISLTCMILCYVLLYTDHPGVDDPLSMRNIRVNGDGFGIAWYDGVLLMILINFSCFITFCSYFYMSRYSSDSERGDGSCTFKISTPVWSDKNLQRLGHFITAPVIMGHIRAASDGYNKLEAVVISHENCHPFKCGRYTFMHNGGIPSFATIKREVCNLLRLENYMEIDGSTDSEHIFALFLNNLCSKDVQLPASAIAESLNQTIGTLLELCAVHKIGPSSLNITVTDGVHIVVSRFRNSAYSQPPSLYYSIGSHYSAEEGNFTVVEGPSGQPETHNGVLVSSCPLSKECVEPVDSDSACCSTTWSEYMLRLMECFYCVLLNFYILTLQLCFDIYYQN